jgi:hypothetical protein
MPIPVEWVWTMTKGAIEHGERRKMTFKLTVACDNDAFYGEAKHAELARILREIADALEERGGLMGTAVRDINGNTVGKATFGR